MKQKIRPLHDRILIKRLDSEQKTAGGIIIPDNAQEKTQSGTVIAAGQGRVNAQGAVSPLNVKEGNVVLFGKYSGTEVTLGGEEYLILKEDEVLGIIEK